MNKQRALDILGPAIVAYELLLARLGYDEEAGEQKCIKDFEMTEEEHAYILGYNCGRELREELSRRDLGGAELINDEEEEDE